MAGAIAGVTGASPERRRLVSNLLFCDVLCANVYVMFLLSCIGACRAYARAAPGPDQPPLLAFATLLPTLPVAHADPRTRCRHAWSRERRHSQ